MALTIPTGPQEPCTLDECIAALDRSGFDPQAPDSVAHAAKWLARLAANPDFLGEIALDQLKDGCRRSGGQGYSPQVIMLGAARPGWFLRANIWPSAEDAVVRESGEAAFVYGLPHDHNFDFLTVGYHGPGYSSDHYEVDPATITGVVGEKPGLRFTGTSVLQPGRVMHYRARRDIHRQHAPTMLSVSINLMHSAPGQRWTDQFQYDLESGSIAKVLTRCTGDTLAKLALALDPAKARDLLEHIALRHPIQRLRWSAIAALAQSEPDWGARREYLARIAADAEGWLEIRCRTAIGD
jgi:hypothetical protein